MLEIEQERQARAKADKQLEALRAQVAATELRERQAALSHAELAAKLEARCDAAVSVERMLRQTLQTLEGELRTAQEKLQASQQDAMRYRTQAETVQGMLDRMSAPAAPVAPLGRRQKKTE